MNSLLSIYISNLSYSTVSVLCIDCLREEKTLPETVRFHPSDYVNQLKEANITGHS